MISGIVDNCKDDSAIKLADSYITMNGHKKRKVITQSWDFLVQSSCGN